MVRSLVTLGSLHPIGALTGLLTVLILGACSSRTLTIESQPAGARVILNRTEIGVTPVTVPYRYGGINEILILPDPQGPEGTPYKPALVYHDTWRFALDFPVVDGFADLFGTEDHQGVSIALEEDETVKLLRRDKDSREEVLSGLRARADLLRQRARELFIDAPPTAPPSAPIK